MRNWKLHICHRVVCNAFDSFFLQCSWRNEIMVASTPQTIVGVVCARALRGKILVCLRDMKPMGAL